MSVLFTPEIIDAAVALLKAASLSFSPKIIQKGDIAFYPEGTLANIIPAVFVKASGIEVSIGEHELGGRDVDTFTNLRVVVVDDYSSTEQPTDLKPSRGEEVAEAFIASSNLNMDETINGYTIFTALPTGVEFQPPEDELVSLNDTRKLFAVAINVQTWGRASR